MRGVPELFYGYPVRTLGFHRLSCPMLFVILLSYSKRRSEFHFERGHDHFVATSSNLAIPLTLCIVQNHITSAVVTDTRVIIHCSANIHYFNVAHMGIKGGFKSRFTCSGNLSPLC